MSFVLRPYQDKIVRDARAAVRAGHKSIIIVLPTGGGKTAISASIIGGAVQRGNSCWFVNHRRELIRQSSKTFMKVGISHGIVSSGFTMNRQAPAQICGIQTLVNRTDMLNAPMIIFWDECHHIAAGQWAKIFSLYPDAIHIGVTATPCRLDGAGLGDWFGHMIEGPSARWLIDNEYLSKYRLFGAPQQLDLSGVKKAKKGDFIADALAELVDKPRITGDAIDHYRRYCPGAPNIVFAANVKHSMHIVEQYNAAGYQAVHLDGTTDQRVRDAALRDFERGVIKVLSNVDLFGEGFDVPGIVAVTQLRPTASTSLDMQQKGRGLRTAEGKPFAYMFDHVGNWQRHGLPDEDRVWNLDPKVKVKRAANDNDEDDIKIRQCTECFGVHAPAPTCPHCGHVYEVKSRKIEEVEGELVEIDIAAARRAKMREQAAARTLEELITVGKDRGMKNPHGWAKHVLASRQSKEDNRMKRYG